MKSETTMLFGYVRVNTNSKNIDLQIDALLKYGVKENNITIEADSEYQTERKNLNYLLKKLRLNDTLVVWKINRLATSNIHFIKVMNDLIKKEIKFKSISEPYIDTTYTTKYSKHLVGIITSLAEMEKNIITERIKAGHESAKKKGKVLGAPKGLSKKNIARAKLCSEYYKEKKLNIGEICILIGISKATLYKYLRYEGLKIRNYNNTIKK